MDDLIDLFALGPRIVRMALTAAVGMAAITFAAVFVGGTIQAIIDYRRLGWWR